MKPTFHIVSHTHWDREWYRSFEQFRSMLVSMIDDLIDILSKDKSFRSFLLDGQVSVVEDYLEIKPGRFANIARLAAERRLFVGPWYVLPDEFLVSAESLVRNLLTGMRLAKKLGGAMKIGYIPDSFGHTSMMPAILNGFGIDTAVIYRGFGGEASQNASEYWWKSPDGSKCLMFHLPKRGYSGFYFAGESDDNIIKRFEAFKKETDSRSAAPHRLIMNGGDHHWPDPGILNAINILNRNSKCDFIHSNLPDFFESLRKNTRRLKEVRGELRFGYRYAFAVTGGVYSSRMYIKQANWHTQLMLERYAEPVHAYAASLGMKSQSPLIRQAWKHLLHNHPHDSICGCSIDTVHKEMLTRFQSAEDIGKAVIEASLEHLIPPDGKSAKDDRFVSFFNPSHFHRSGIFCAELKFYKKDVVVGLSIEAKHGKKHPPLKGFRLLDDRGREIPCQIVSREEGYDITYSRYGYPVQTIAAQFRVLVRLEDVPPLGFKCLSVEKTSRFPEYPSSLKTGKNFLENENLRVEINSRGEVRIIDKIQSKTYSGLNIFEDTGDVGDEYNYSYPAKDTTVRSNGGKVKITLIENGPLRAALKVMITMRVPSSASQNKQSRSRKTTPLELTTVLYLAADSRALDIESTVENTAKDHRLRVLFPSGIKTDTAYADSQFCIAVRRQKKFNLKQFKIEHPAPVAPMQRFVTVKDSNKGLTLFSYGIPEYELKLDGKGTLALTLLRCVGLLAGDNLITRPGGKAGWHNETPDAQCPGIHKFRYAVLPHSPSEYDRMELLNRESERFHLPLIPIRRKNEARIAPPEPFISVSPAKIALSAIKDAEEGRGFIVRLYNPTAKEIDVKMISSKRIENASLLRLDEKAIKALDVAGGHRLLIKAAPYAVISVRLELEEMKNS